MKPRHYIALAVLAVLGIIWVGPYYTVYQLKKSVKAKDAARIADHVDFARLRQNLKDQLNARAVNAIQHKRNDPAATIAAGLTGLFAGAVVDQMVTPAGLATMMRGQSVNPLKKSTGGTTEPFGTVRFRFNSFDTFSAYVPDQQGHDIRFVLTRDWFDWKLTNVILPGD
ncbi:hypothetical protein GCM10028803_57270 [Larkinella knui]|uniref:DUF2939 domain-containing protein n=1 Tax=Larkinella knui TaxID=2025310 RepID=A0A3P1CHU8_9BACT|nr:DUF2939 domain-containing protein [Larkinella knui]RRB12830.1 DUF2939 domain-containing protein [Larkinella knui]